MFKGGKFPFKRGSPFLSSLNLGFKKRIKIKIRNILKEIIKKIIRKDITQLGGLGLPPYTVGSGSLPWYLAWAK